MFKVMEQNFSEAKSKEGTLSTGGQQLIIFQMTWRETGHSQFLKDMVKTEKTQVRCELCLNQNNLSDYSSVGVLR